MKTLNLDDNYERATESNATLRIRLPDFKTGNEDYRRLVKWWFTSAYQNDEYRDNTITKPFKDLEDLDDKVNSAANWLLTTGTEETDIDGRYISRKKDLHKFLTNRLAGKLKESSKDK